MNPSYVKGDSGEGKIMHMKKLLIPVALGLVLAMIMPIIANAAVPGDINDDGKVDITDIVLAAGQYDRTPGDPEYDSAIVAKADLAPNGIIDIFDLVTMVLYYTG